MTLFHFPAPAPNPDELSKAATPPIHDPRDTRDPRRELLTAIHLLEIALIQVSGIAGAIPDLAARLRLADELLRIRSALGKLRSEAKALRAL